MWGLPPLHIIADQLRRFGHTFDFGAGVSARSKAIWNSKLAKEVLVFFDSVIHGKDGARQSATSCAL